MTINELKADARTIFYNNKEKAAKNWSKCWGLGWWFDLWQYKEYKLYNLMYRTGKAYFRHHSESIVAYYIDGKEVSRKEFLSILSTITHQPKQSVTIAKTKETAKQLELF